MVSFLHSCQGIDFLTHHVNVVAVAFIMVAEDKCDLHRLPLLGATSFQVLLGFNVVHVARTEYGTKELWIESTKLII